MPEVTDNFARGLAAEAKELAVRVDITQSAHEKACEERHSDMKRWQDESVKNRHELRNDMLGSFGELRASVAALLSEVHKNSLASHNAYIAVAGAIILLLIGALGYMISKNGL